MTKYELLNRCRAGYVPTPEEVVDILTRLIEGRRRSGVMYEHLYFDLFVPKTKKLRRIGSAIEEASYRDDVTKDDIITVIRDILNDPEITDDVR